MPILAFQTLSCPAKKGAKDFRTCILFIFLQAEPFPNYAKLRKDSETRGATTFSGACTMQGCGLLRQASTPSRRMAL